MGIYNRYILPYFVDNTCSKKTFQYQRNKIVPSAKGRVLEIGIGSGLNLPFYNPEKVELVWGVDPDARMREMAEKRASRTQFEVEFVGLSGEQIPLEKNAADTILVTYTLCSIPDILKALNEMRRVLKPGGELIFCEHGRAPDKSVRLWQERLTPVWRILGGGCDLDRDIPALIEKGGFRITHLDTMYIPGFKPACFNFRGTAIPDIS